MFCVRDMSQRYVGWTFVFWLGSILRKQSALCQLYNKNDLWCCSASISSESVHFVCTGNLYIQLSADCRNLYSFIGRINFLSRARLLLAPLERLQTVCIYIHPISSGGGGQVPDKSSEKGSRDRSASHSQPLSAAVKERRWTWPERVQRMPTDSSSSQWHKDGLHSGR